MLKHTTPYIHSDLLFHRMKRRLPSELQSAEPITLLLKDKSAGLYAMIFQVMGAIQLCRRLSYNLIIDFDKGFYHDPGLHSNWWMNYFENNEYSYASKKGRLIIIDELNIKDQFTFYGRDIHPLVAHDLISTIKIKSLIRKKLEYYYLTKFKNRLVIGVHYRGTDKVQGAWVESVRVPYEYICQYVDKYPLESRIFIATDEEPFLEYMIGRYNDRILYYDSIRSRDGMPIHIPLISKSNAYKAGEDAIIDSLLLSKCSYLIRTDSNLSLGSTYYNPKLNSIDVTAKYIQKHSECRRVIK